MAIEESSSAAKQGESAKVTIRDVAERAGVGISSVSRALSGHPDVSAKTRQRVVAVAAELKYSPDRLARGLRMGTSKTVGFLVRDISNPLFADIVKGAEDLLRSQDYALILANSEGNPDLDADYIQVLQQRRVDGLIVSLETEDHPLTTEALRRVNCPLVLLDREIEGLEVGKVLCDHYAGVKEAVAHILGSGHRYVGLIAGPAGLRASLQRVHGYEDAHRAAGVPVVPGLTRFGGYTEEFGYQQTCGLIDGDPAPTALVSGGIQLSVGSLRALHDRGVRIGDDMSFVSCDEVALMSLLDPPLNVVARNAIHMGRLAAELLVGRMTGSDQQSVGQIGTRYVRSESVRPLQRTFW